MTGLSSFNESMSKRVLDLLETSYLRLRELVLKKIAAIKFGVNSIGGSGRVDEETW